ncbi:MAG: rod shape-determining protein MreD [Clostridiaceae bacterium]|jgi:rod shape-determining protein MreD|nr:rod shape-determining protein MreD [Clostridiaceae bacterium]
MKKKALFYFFFIVLFLLLQTTLLQYVAIYGVKPNILVVFIIVTALLRGESEGAPAGFFAGLSLDLMFGSAIGFYALLGLYLGIAVGATNKKIFRENILIVVFFTFIYSLAYESLVYIVNNIMSGDMNFLYALTRTVLPESAYNCVVAVLLFPLVMKAGKWFDGADKKVRKY